LHTHTTNSFAFKFKSADKTLVIIPRCSAPSQHRVLFGWFKKCTSQQMSVFICFEIRKSNDGLMWVRYRGKLRDPLGQSLHIEFTSIYAVQALLNALTNRTIRYRRRLQQSHGVNPDR